MTTSRCRSCGTEYLTGIDRCPGCDAPSPGGAALGPGNGGGGRDAGGDGGDGAGGGSTGGGSAGGPPAGAEVSGQVAYEFHLWSREARSMLEQLLAGAGIRRSWSGTDLAVDVADEAAVDEMVDEVDATLGVEASPPGEMVVYEVGDWTMDQLGILTGALGSAGIHYEFDIEGDLGVRAADEERTEALLDSLDLGLDDGSGAGEAPADGLETLAVLSDLFVACDRLHNNPTDPDGVLGAVKATGLIEGRPLPFGYEVQVWAAMIDRTRRLREMLEDDSVPDEAIVEDASALRALLLQYI